MNLAQAKKLRRKHRILAKVARYNARRDAVRQVTQTYNFPQAKLNWWEKLKLKFYGRLQK